MPVYTRAPRGVARGRVRIAKGLVEEISFYFHTTGHTVTKTISLARVFAEFLPRIKTRTPIAPSRLFGTRDSRSFRVKL